jgi:predicted TPR repeat methyltransferase
MLAEAVRHHQAGRLAEARTLYEEILRLDERNPNALNLLGMVHHAEGRQEHASELVSRAIELAPGVAGFHNNRGTIRLAQRRATEAEESFRTAIGLQNDYVEAINNLGVALTAQGKMDEAIAQLLRAIKLRHAYPSARNNLGNALRGKRLFAEAVACYRDALEFKPDHAEAWANMGVAMLEMKDLAGAEAACRRAIELKSDAVSPHFTLGLALEDAGRNDEAIEQYRAALRLKPASLGIRFQLAALAGENREAFPTAPPEMVASLFDHYADTFDRHLLGTLNYRGPQLVHDAVVAAGAKGPADVADLGCGTGLCGPLLRPIARSLVGVDLSARMVHQARERKVYDALFVEELTGFLAGRFSQFDVAVAADVFSYFGDLSGVFAAAAQALRKAGLLAFTVEKLTDPDADDAPGFMLKPTRRYAHTIEYVRSLLPAVKMKMVSAREDVLRSQNLKDVAAWVVVLQREDAKT